MRPLNELARWALCLGLAASSVTVAGQEDGSVQATATADRAAIQVATEASREHLRRVMDESRLPGLSVTVALRGAIIWSEGLGWADLEHEVPVSSSTRFRVGSVSKPFAALLALTLAKQGRLDLDAPVQTYVPGFPEKSWPVTPRLLLCHMGGIRHYQGAEFLENRFDGIDAGLEVFASDPLVARPGTGFRYSSYGYNLLGAALAAACESEYARCLDEHVLAPLGLDSVVPDDPSQVIKGRSRSYVLADDSSVLNAPPHDLLYKLPAGGLLSTTEDLARFAMAHLVGSLIDPRITAQLFESQSTLDGEDIGFGLGWVITRDDAGRSLWGHLGGVVGGCSILLIYPDEQLVVALAANLDADWSERPATTVGSLFIKAIEGEPAVDMKTEPDRLP